MNSNSESIVEEFREWHHSNRDLCRMSTHCTRFKMKGLRKERVRGQMFQVWHAGRRIRQGSSKEQE